MIMMSTISPIFISFCRQDKSNPGYDLSFRFMCPDFASLENVWKFYSLTGKFLLSS